MSAPVSRASAVKFDGQGTHSMIGWSESTYVEPRPLHVQHHQSLSLEPRHLRQVRQRELGKRILHARVRVIERTRWVI